MQDTWIVNINGNTRVRFGKFVAVRRIGGLNPMDVTVKRFLVDRTKHLAPDRCGQDVDIFDSCPTSLQLHHLS